MEEEKKEEVVETKEVTETVVEPTPVPSADTKEEVKQDNNKGKGGIILLVILLILALGVGGFFAYKYFTRDNNELEHKEEEKKEEEQNKEEESLEISDSDIKKIADKIQKNKLVGLIHGGSQSFTDKPNDNQLELFVFYSNLGDTTKKNFDEYYYSSYGVKPVEHKDILCENDDEIYLKYDNSKETYIFNKEHPGHGMYQLGYIDYYVPYSKKEGNKYTIEFIFFGPGGEADYNINGISKTDDDTGDIFDYFKSSIDWNTETGVKTKSHELFVKDCKDFIENHVDEYKKIDKYQFVFEKVNDDFYLKEIKVIKQSPKEDDKKEENEHQFANKPDFSDPTKIKEKKDLYHIVDAEEFDIYGYEDAEKGYKNRNIKISFDYPVIDIDTDEIKKLNKYIHDEYQEQYYLNLRTKAASNTNLECVAIKKDGKYYDFHHIFSYSYEIYENDKYLSIMLDNNSYTECAGGSSYYKGYVIDKSTKKLMTNSELIKVFNVTEKTILDSYNSNSFEDNKVTSIDKIELFVLEGKLHMVTKGNGDTIYKYDGIKFEMVEFND